MDDDDDISFTFLTSVPPLKQKHKNVLKLNSKRKSKCKWNKENRSVNLAKNLVSNNVSGYAKCNNISYIESSSNFNFKSDSENDLIKQFNELQVSSKNSYNSSVKSCSDSLHFSSSKSVSDNAEDNMRNKSIKVFGNQFENRQSDGFQMDNITVRKHQKKLLRRNQNSENDDGLCSAEQNECDLKLNSFCDNLINQSEPDLDMFPINCSKIKSSTPDHITSNRHLSNINKSRLSFTSDNCDDQNVSSKLHSRSESKEVPQKSNTISNNGEGQFFNSSKNNDTDDEGDDKWVDCDEDFHNNDSETTNSCSVDNKPTKTRYWTDVVLKDSFIVSDSDDESTDLLMYHRLLAANIKCDSENLLKKKKTVRERAKNRILTSVPKKKLVFSNEENIKNNEDIKNQKFALLGDSDFSSCNDILPDTVKQLKVNKEIKKKFTLLRDSDFSSCNDTLPDTVKQLKVNKEIEKKFTLLRDSDLSASSDDSYHSVKSDICDGHANNNSSHNRSPKFTLLNNSDFSNDSASSIHCDSDIKCTSLLQELNLSNGENNCSVSFDEISPKSSRDDKASKQNSVSNSVHQNENNKQSNEDDKERSASKMNYLIPLCNKNLSKLLSANTKLKPCRSLKTTPRKNVKLQIPEELSNSPPADNYCTFLESFSEYIPDSMQRHPLAVYYTTKYKRLKEELAHKLFKFYNREVFENKLPSDLVIEWSSRMRSTSGYCRNQRLTKRYPDGKIIIERVAKLALSRKILISPDRLRDTLIHELCHAATWIISERCGDGHGPVWSSWTRKAMKRFPELPKIVRYHNYYIKTKYTYRCKECGYAFGRHCKSLDITRRRCGYCRGEFKVILNTSNSKGSASKKPKKLSKFAQFVKENYNPVKQKNTCLKHGQIMKLLSEQFANTKITTE